MIHNEFHFKITLEAIKFGQLIVSALQLVQETRIFNRNRRLGC